MGRRVSDRRALVSIDLGAESCRVSLLDWRAGKPEIRMVRRFANGPVERGEGLFWDIERILSELEAGLRQCAEAAPQGVASIGVTGWAVDYVRLDGEGRRLGLPHCYRDPRNGTAMEALHCIVPEDELYARTGVQIQPINTIYQLYADQCEAVPPGARWV